MGEGPHAGLKGAHQHRRRQTLSGDVPQADAEPAAWQAQEVECVPSDGKTGKAGSVKKVAGDFRRLPGKQVLLNLLSNSTKYSDSGKRIWIRAEQEADCVIVEVQDEGVGIHEDDLGRIFQRFERAESSVQTGVRGTGLGLAIVKRILELHGGNIDVESRPGKGSTFRFNIPIKSNESN